MNRQFWITTRRLLSGALLWLLLVATVVGQQDSVDFDPPRKQPPAPSVYLRVPPGESFKLATPNPEELDSATGSVLPPVTKAARAECHPADRDIGADPTRSWHERAVADQHAPVAVRRA